MGNSGFDPSLFHDDDGRNYLYRPWGRLHQQPAQHHCDAEFDPQTGHAIARAQNLFTGTPLCYTERRAPLSPRGMVLPDGGRKAAPATKHAVVAAFKNHRRAVRGCTRR